MDLSDSRLVITYSNERCHVSVYDSNGTMCTVKGIAGNGDSVLESGERFKVIMDFTQIELCGAACADLALEQAAEVNYYCDPG